MHGLRRRAKRFTRYFDPAGTARYVRSHCGAEAAEVLRQAELLLGQTFVFTDRWDMEPCAVPYTIDLKSWVQSPNGDPEWVFMLNRHDFLHKLWQAYVLTGEKTYAARLRHLILDWIERNPITRNGTDATRTIDTGIRCMNWITLLPHLLAEDILSDGDAELVIDALREQFVNMRSRYIGKYALSNWGVLQTTAICAGYAWYPEFLPDGLDKWAWAELKLQLSLQILGDGSHWEQSPMYHVEVLNTCVRLLCHLNAARAAGLPPCPEAEAAVKAGEVWTDEREARAGPGEGYDPEANGWLVSAIRVLSRHVLYTADPRFFQLPHGDSDVTDVRDVMARAAVLLEGGGIYRFAAGDAMDMDSAWLLGVPGIEAFSRLRPVRPERRVWNCPDSGNLFLRSGWSENANFTWMKNGSLGSSHGHADQTQLCIHYKGKPFLIDSGRCTYREDDPLRVLLKRPCAHNVCVIDRQSGGVPNGSWSYHRYDEPLKNYYAQAGDAHYTEMAFHGALGDGTPYLIWRKVLTLEQGVWISVQDVICQGSHRVREYFHLAGPIAVYPGDERFLLRNEDVSLALYTRDRMEFRFGVISERYNEKRYAPILVKDCRMEDRLTASVVLADPSDTVKPVPVYQLRREAPVSDDVACAWDIEKTNGTKWTVILWNRETCRGDKLYTCHGRSVYGKAVVLAWNGDDCRVIRLKT